MDWFDFLIIFTEEGSYILYNNVESSNLREISKEPFYYN